MRLPFLKSNQPLTGLLGSHPIRWVPSPCKNRLRSVRWIRIEWWPPMSRRLSHQPSWKVQDFLKTTLPPTNMEVQKGPGLTGGLTIYQGHLFPLKGHLWQKGQLTKRTVVFLQGSEGMDPRNRWEGKPRVRSRYLLVGESCWLEPLKSQCLVKPRLTAAHFCLWGTPSHLPPAYLKGVLSDKE